MLRTRLSLIMDGYFHHFCGSFHYSNITYFFYTLLLYNTSFFYIHIIIYKKLMERKVSGSTGAGHRGIDTH